MSIDNIFVLISCLFLRVFFKKIVPFELYFPFQTLDSCPRVDSHPPPFFLLLSELSPDVVKKLKAEQ